MEIYDAIVAAVVVVFVVRGWLRGLLREAIEIGVLVAGVFLVFRFSPALGSIIAGMANVPYEVARIAAGALLFLVLVIGGAIVARLLAVILKVIPGASTLNRLGGSLVGAGYAALVVILATTLLSVVPISEGMKETLGESFEASSVGRLILEPDGPIQQTMSLVSGESVFSTVISIQDAVGGRLAAGTLPIPLPDVGDASLAPSQVAAQQVFDTLNRTRIAEGLDPLAWSVGLATVAVSRSVEVYRSGRLMLDEGLSAALAAQGVPGTINTDMVVLAASPEGIAEAFTGTSSYTGAIHDRQYRKAGIGVVDGPFGLLTVLILSG